ncbi:PucR family transcriptional regulator [Agromyces aerolatus]|uniref:PucR family transcriptional regulator n=1 Tax=Agromyces sp. LY-1074 TaxID=3074080 RepID=UPI00285C4681|nr:MULTISPECIES: PucR family transcriptional regulator [unclassified Agromyces]MDR5701227.1 PucR family transcriptional regulator [Agromyces sp. LY-1074]MDR5706897.1 PucR family transcriptional regulator [Agromyces sp. LY-1358]
MAEVLGLGAVADGRPEVLTGDAGLAARVRWVHVSDSADVARLLNGGELLLSTGSGWPAEPAELEAFVAGLVGAGVAGLVLELGVHFRYVPAIIVDAARRHGLTLVVLHREVKFVALTEAVHRHIISEQTAALRARDEVRAQFTALALRGSPADFIVHRLAQTLDAPVVLENLAHEIVTAEVPPGAEEELFGDWEARSRRARAGVIADAPDAGPHGADARIDDGDGWLIVSVEARGIRWGRLIALPGPVHPAGRAGVLEQGAIALALGRLADGGVDEWARTGRQRLLEALLAGRFSGVEAATARVEAAGLPVVGARLVGVVATGEPIAPEVADAAARTIGARALAMTVPVPNTGAEGLARGSGQADRRQASTHDVRRSVATALLLSIPGGDELTDRAARAFAHGLVPAGVEHLVLDIGAAGEGLEAGIASLQEAIDLARAGATAGLAAASAAGAAAAGAGRLTGRGPVLRRADDRPLVRLVASLRDDQRVLEHGERMLAPLVEHDLRRQGDLLEVLGAVLAHPANRTAAATASHLSRSVFYQRLTLIQDLLGVDLDDGETQTALHLALLVRRASRR